jgi:hypothetical protein
VTCYTQPCNPYKVICLLYYLPLGDESSPRGRWSICAPALPEVLTIDASKFFHMFLTVDEERRFVGLIHPDTGDHYWYTRLPMGSSNYPEVSGRFGAAFLRLIFQEVEEMQGEVLINDWKVALEGDDFDPKLGIGRVLIGYDRLPACLIWIHVDDIFLQGPTRTKCTSALKKILDLTVLVGLISHPTKLKPPAQIQKFCGFLYDSVGLLI